MDRFISMAVDISTKASTAGFDAVTDSAGRMDDAVDRASRTADDAGTRMGALGDHADNLDDKFGRATGALGALSSGFDLIGASGASETLMSIGLATDFVSGVGQSLMLVTEAENLANIKAAASATLHAGAEKARAVASKAGAAAQWALNIAMEANPIGLIIVAVIALVALFVTLYKKSDTFRGIVQATMQAGATAVGWVVDKVSDLAGWVSDHLGPAFSVFADAASKIWQKISDKMGAFQAAALTVKDAVVGYFDLMLAPIRTLIGLVEDLIHKLGSIHLPDLHIPNPFGRTTGAASTGSDPFAGWGAGTLGGTAPVSLTINVDGSGIVDPNAVASAIDTVLRRYWTANNSPSPWGTP